VAGFILAVSVLLLTVHLPGNALEFSRYNTEWNGSSHFFSDLDRHRLVEVTTPADLNSAGKNDILLIIAPSHTPTSAEIAGYREFLDRGNTILIADDFGTGNDILLGLGSRIAILNGNLSSMDRGYSDPYSVVAYRVSNSTLAFNGDSVLLNRPAALTGGKTILLTSVMSWIDTNTDRKINLQELMGTFAVMAEEKVGNGNLIVLSDASIFTNTMYEADETYDNRLLLGSISGGQNQIFIDQMNSRTGDVEGISGILSPVRSNLAIKIIFLFILMLLLMAAWKGRFL
jgi:hypothetical protein